MGIVKKSLVLWGAVAIITIQGASAVTETETTGKVCGHECPQYRLEQFGGYSFQGKTSPSRNGHIVVFHFKRPWGTRWRPFKTGPADGSNAFHILDKNRGQDQ